MYDIIVIGGGPAGLTAALYALRANKTVLVIEKSTFGGQITFSPKVENYPGFLQMSGNEFADKLVEQVLAQGAEIELSEVTQIVDGEIKKVITEDGEFEGKAVIIATGAKHRMLGLENEEKLVGEGISFCAVCDGAFYKDKEVAVIGGGNSALQEAILLTQTASKVYVIQDLDFLTGEKRLAEQLEANNKVKIITGHRVTALKGETELKGIVITDSKTGDEKELVIDGMFVAIGLIPQNEIFSEVIALDERGYADGKEDCTTKTPGIFIAGDCRSKKIRQVATAISDGAIAALAACEYIEK